MASPQICDGRHYIIASGRGHTLAQAYELIAEIARGKTGRRIDIVRVAEPPDLHLIEKRNFVGNSRVFQDHTGWRPRFNLRAGIIDYFDRAAQLAKAH
jgi:nucleoside-diphosphate-sugar epimerase